MTISLEAISFNHVHDPASATRDAFTIRKNQIADVTVPEWKRATTLPGDSPALYTIGQLSENRLTIKAQFGRQNADPSSVEVHAVGKSGNVLGDVKSRTITFENGLSAVELFELETPQPNPGVGVWDIAWDWLVEGTLLQTTEHRIYTIVKPPEAPWGQPGSSFPGFQVPWTEVLEHACRQAAGAKNADDAAAKLTGWVYSLGVSKLGYDDYGSGSSHFTIGGMRTFKCTKFLELLAGGLVPRGRVNCTDCATILSSFANILGCNLTQSRIGFEFETNRIQKIGLDSPVRQPFKFHEVAWKFPPEGAPSVYDCCLRLDGDANPADDHFSPTLAINLPMGVPARSGYHFRLIAPTNGGEACQESRKTRLRRKIDGRTATRVTVDPKQRRRLEQEHDFSAWKGTPKQNCCSRHKKQIVSSEVASTSDRQLFLKNYSFNKGLQSPAGWTAGHIESFEAGPDPLRLTDVVWSSNGCSEAALRVLTYECSSLTSARSFLLDLLAEFELPGIKRRLDFVVGCKQVKIGDIAFAGADDLVLLFARANNVILIQNVGRTFVPVSGFAHELDSDMTSSPNSKTAHMIEMEEFHVSNEQIRVGEDIPIHTKAGFVTKEKETLLKFFAPSGHVLLRGDDLLYRPLTGGDQSVTILAYKAPGETARQVLKLFVELPASSQETECSKLDNPNKEEENVMPDITGTWSSIRPTNNGKDSADMTVDGYIEISKPFGRGEIRGFYRDSRPHSETKEMKGHFTSILPNSYNIELSHAMGEGVTRYYYGQLVAIDGNDDFGVQIVAGRYSDVVDDTHDSDAPGAPDPVGALDSGQENGTWVATKP
jgi:hypothetical protein